MPARKRSKSSSSPRSSPASLADYRSKRNFKTSPEPGPRVARVRKKKGLTFCVQKHLASHLHYDFRLEHNGVLLSWAVPKGPSLNPKERRLAMRVEDHPFDYAEFEGVIPEGYGAGIVMVWDRGVWIPEPGFEDVESALVNGELKFRLEGVKLKGSWVLVRTHSDGYPEGRTWLLIKHRDEWAGEVDVTTAAPNSVKSFGDFADILSKDKPDVWESHRPAKGGAAGQMLAEIVEQAARMKVSRKAPRGKAPAGAKNGGKTRPTARRTGRARSGSK